MWTMKGHVLLAVVCCLIQLVFDVAGYRKEELCEGADKSRYFSCRAGGRKLKVLVVDWGIVDAGTGASNRHLEILASLGMLGHTVLRGAIRARAVATTQLPPAAKSVFEDLDIRQVKKKLHHYPSLSADEYVRTLADFDPDAVILTLWFCGPTLNDTTPGYLIDAHRQAGHRAKLIIESSDVHTLREEWTIADGPELSMQGREPREARASRMKALETRFYSRMAADAVVAISFEDREKMRHMLLTSGAPTAAPIHVVRYAQVRTESSQVVSTEAGTTPTPVRAGFGQRHGYIFVGPAGTLTNRAAVEWFLKEVWPRIWEAHDTAHTASSGAPSLTIVGTWKLRGKRNTVGETTMKALTCQRAVTMKPGVKSVCSGYLSAIRFTGKLSESDLLAALDAARVFVSPIVFSTGVNTKHLLALDNGLPLVTTAAGIGGLCRFASTSPDANAGTDPGESSGPDGTDVCASGSQSGATSSPFLVVDGAAAFAVAARRAHNDEKLWESLSANGRRHSAEHLSLKAAAGDMDRVMRGLGLV